MALSTQPRWLLRPALATLALALTTSCGGGGGGSAATSSPSAQAAPGTPVSALYVAGDSLADVGTFGLKATVQKAADRATGYPIYPELVASALGVARPCNHFASSDGLVFTTRAGCTDFAVGGAEVVNPITRAGSEGPFSLQFQLESALADRGGAWQAGDLVLVDAGANDAASLAEAYRNARGGSTAAQATFVALLGQQLGASAIDDALAQGEGGSVAANLYMQQLARTYWTTVKARTLDHGATRVALLNVPDITLTPRFRSIAAEIAAAEGAAAGTAFQAALRQWITTFNTELAGLAAGEPRVALVPYFEDFSAQINQPGAYGLTNTTAASCPPSSDFPACTDAALDAAPPAGLAAGWWTTWYFSDEFHPTPYGHALLAATVNRALARAGWR